MSNPDAAHLLKRTTMAAHPRRMDDMGDRSLSDCIDRLLDGLELDGGGAAKVPWSSSNGPPSGDEDWGRVSAWWVKRMSSAESGLADRMAWIWHQWFTTADESFDGQRLAVDQLTILYRYGLSDLRTLVHKLIGSGAMLRYLDAAGSSAYNPNENLARELMELFTIGPDNYTEHDVRAAARALAGWDVDDKAGKVWFDHSEAFVAPLVFLDTQAVWDSKMVLDALVDHPSTHRRVVTYLWDQLVGTEVDESQIEELAKMLRAEDLQLLPVVESILRSDEFAAAGLNRYADSVEWVVAVGAATDPDGDLPALEPWHLDNLGQRPFNPPSPAGWPDGTYWTRPGSLLPRVQHAQELDGDAITRRAWTPQKMLAAAGLPATDPISRRLQIVLNDDRFEPADRRRIAWRLVVTCPTFQMI